MNTPIYDFVKNYAASDTARFHMPGHKGVSRIGAEPFDITEIHGADSLFSADGMIAESENNAARLFGAARTFYSAEGSSLAIRAMLFLAVSGLKEPCILAARGAHKSFLYALALTGADVDWIYPKASRHLCSAAVAPQEVEETLRVKKYAAVYVTSPDYLGNVSDISGIASVCRKYGTPLLVDNAHGAYLAFLSETAHPIALGADMCCDSAHKTLPVLTGGAYLHMSERAAARYAASARNALSLFASTSPSYLILASLDLCNKYLADGYSDRLAATVSVAEKMKLRLLHCGIPVCPSEPLKIVIDGAKIGYTGNEISALLRSERIEAEFSDLEYSVLMLTPDNSASDLERLENALLRLEKRAPVLRRELVPPVLSRKMTVREAVFAPHEYVSRDFAAGRICGAPTVSCPPAVPIAVSGEEITADAVDLFRKYGIERIEVVKND